MRQSLIQNRNALQPREGEASSRLLTVERSTGLSLAPTWNENKEGIFSLSCYSRQNKTKNSRHMMDIVLKDTVFR